MSETKLKIEGMSCNHCVRSVTEALKGVDGVESATVSLESGTAVVTGSADVNALVSAVTEEGFTASAA